MITLVDYYNQSSWDLHYSLLKSGFNHPMIAIQDDGFLPDDVTSPYLYYTGYTNKKEKGNPLYFNQVMIPEFWEIRATNNEGGIYNYNKKCGHIHYAQPSHLRLVSAVDWYDDSGKIRYKDRYNRFGKRYAQSIYNLQGEMILTTYFRRNGQEAIVENHQTGDIIVNKEGKIVVHKTRHDFVIAYLRDAGFELDRIYYNSLSTPFLVAFYLGGSGKDVLFWQEDIHGSVPGNMQLLLEGHGRETKIVVQKKETYHQLRELVSPKHHNQFDCLGFLYPFKINRKKANDILILTNSDQLDHIDFFVSQFQDCRFHIAAITEMSSRLTNLSRYSNVSLYPNIGPAMIQMLYEKSKVYLDINRGNEILTAIRTAFEHQLVILGFSDTVHNRQFVSDTAIYHLHEVSQFAEELYQILTNECVYKERLYRQEQAAQCETINRYKQVLGGF